MNINNINKHKQYFVRRPIHLFASSWNIKQVIQEKKKKKKVLIKLQHREDELKQCSMVIQNCSCSDKIVQKAGICERPRLPG